MTRFFRPQSSKVTVDKNSELGILGGGLSGLAFAYFSGLKAHVIEKEKRPGGLCRSFDANGIKYDIGPHILFSKKKRALDFLTSLTPMHKLRRSNKILYKGRLVKYPFENELSALPEYDRDWCLNAFVNNPYEEYSADNMLAFFYKTFGEGITRAYLEPYNRKIWKFEPSFMDTQMVERIPKPPAEDIIKSAKGVETEGYLHQLYFSYPDQGGTEAVIKGLIDLLGERLVLHTGATVERIVKKRGYFEVYAGGNVFEFEHLLSAMPVHELLPVLDPAPPEDVVAGLHRMKYNSIHITVVTTTSDKVADNFAFLVPDPEIPFHRVSKIDFLGDAYHIPDTTTFMAEITFRKGDRFDLDSDAIIEMVVDGLNRIDFVAKSELNFATSKRFEYAYVIYDLHHRQNTDKVLTYLESIGITSIGRFATFEYINMDTSVERAYLAAAKFLRRGSEEVSSGLIS